MKTVMMRIRGGHGARLEASGIAPQEGQINGIVTRIDKVVQEEVVTPMMKGEVVAEVGEVVAEVVAEVVVEVVAGIDLVVIGSVVVAIEEIGMKIVMRKEGLDLAVVVVAVDQEEGDDRRGIKF